MNLILVLLCIIFLLYYFSGNIIMDEPVEAVVQLINKDLGIDGIVLLTEDLKEKNTIIKVKISGLKPNSLHGFHVHVAGDLREGCKSLCDHWNPYGGTHGGLTDSKKDRHAGDLGNLKANSKGVVNTTITDNLIKLRGKYSVMGRSIVLHDLEDDLGRGNNEESKITGNSGARIACGIIGYSKKCK
jgi:Cu-Zn family superoxide dismutase